MIGAYEIVAPLGQGGMATVYRAYHARLNRQVAIKMIHPTYLEDQSFIARFEREAQIVAGLEHPNIVPVYDFSEHEGEPYLVMKLIEGSTLKAILAKGALAVEDIVKIAAPVAQALDYAHQHGVLHRDIKPSNIMLDQQTTPYLTDFGLARISLSGDSTISKDMLLGTPYYIAPEQARDKSAIDHRADLYSFGVVLYELLVGQVPFSSGTPYSIINDHIFQPLPLPSSLNANIPPAIELVLLKALAKDPEDRYGTAADMVADLGDALRSNPPQITLLTEGRQSAADSIAMTTAAPSVTRPAQATMPAKAAALSPRPSHRKLWLWLGSVLGGFSAVAIIVVLMTVLLEPTGSAPATQPPPPRNLQMYNVPELSLDDARAAVANNPNDPVGYLALARAQLLANDDLAARRTITQGMAVADDKIRFEMTAAQGAVQIGRYDAAFLIYSNALVDAQGTDEYLPVRGLAGQYLYGLASSVDRLTAAAVIELNRELQNSPSPIVTAMIARALLQNGNTRLAQSGITKALAEDNTLPEIHLVNGELLHQQGDNQRARAEWELARSADGPPWIRNRANDLINTLS